MDEKTDRIGAVASTLCAAHCAVCALLPAALGGLGLGALASHEAEWAFTAFAIVFAVAALVLGWRQHRSYWVAGALTIGIVGLIGSRGMESGWFGGEDHHGHEAHERVGAEAHGEHGEAHGEHAEAHGEHGEAHGKHAEAHGGHGGAHGDHAEAHGGVHDAHGDAHGDDFGHMAGTLVGVLGGLFLLSGHLMNLREARRCRQACHP